MVSSPGKLSPSRRVLGAAAIAFLAAASWFALGMNRGVLLSSDVKSRCWPWAPSYRAGELQAPVLSDPVWQFVPWLEFARRELADGRLPLWNPHQDGGVPLLGNGQAALGSPLVLPALLLGVASGWNLSLLLRLIVAAAASYLWLRELGPSRLAASLGAVMFALSGPFVSWLEHPHTLTAAAVPLVLLYAWRLMRRPSPGATLGLAFSTATVLAGGHPETALMGAIVVCLLLCAGETRVRGAVRLGTGSVLGVLLAAPVVLPFVEYFFSSAARGGEARLHFVLPLASLVRFVLPHADVGHPIEAAATVSAVGLALALVGVAIGGAQRVRWVAALVAALLMLLAYANPVARFLAEHTPVYWTRAIIFLPLPLGMLAALGLDALRSRAGRVRGGRGAGALAGALALLAGGELVMAARGVHAVTDPADIDRTTPLLQRLAAEHELFRILPLHTFLPPDSATAFGLDDVRGYDALGPAGWYRERRSLGRFTSTSTVSDVLEPWDLARGGTALDFWNVKYLLVHPQLPYTAERLNREFGLDLREVYAGADGRVLENRRVLPRARLAGEGTVRVVQARPTRWRLDTDAPTETVLTLANPMFPGWRARVDGRPVPLGGEAGAAMQVRVPGGRHEVEFRYAPRSFRLGVGLSGLGLALLAGIAVRAGSVRRRLSRDAGAAGA